MRPPRPQDYDPNFKSTIRPEEVDVSDIAPMKPKPELKKTGKPLEENTAASVRGVRAVRTENTNEISPLPSSRKREIKRHAFEIYRDQLETLKQLKMETMLTGEVTSMSEMVRVALDNYIRHRMK